MSQAEQLRRIAQVDPKALATLARRLAEPIAVFEAASRGTVGLDAPLARSIEEFIGLPAGWLASTKPLPDEARIALLSVLDGRGGQALTATEARARQLRRENFAALSRLCTGRVLARALGISAPNVSKLTVPEGGSVAVPFTAERARRYETVLELPHGWLSTAQTDESLRAQARRILEGVNTDDVPPAQESGTLDLGLPPRPRAPAPRLAPPVPERPAAPAAPRALPVDLPADDALWTAFLQKAARARADGELSDTQLVGWLAELVRKAA